MLNKTEPYGESSPQKAADFQVKTGKTKVNWFPQWESVFLWDLLMGSFSWEILGRVLFLSGAMEGRASRSPCSCNQASGRVLNTPSRVWGGTVPGGSLSLSPQNPHFSVTAEDSTRGLYFYNDTLWCDASFEHCDEQEAHQPLPFAATASHLAWICLGNFCQGPCWLVHAM